MRLPVQTFDAWFHMSMAAHYAHHWFNPWNEQSFAGFSQTTYPPLLHQWIAVFSYVVGLSYAYMIVQGTALLLLPVAVYRFALLWTTPRAASYAGFCSIFLGALCVLVYQDGQIATTSSTTLFLLALPLFHRYIVGGARRDLVRGVARGCPPRWAMRSPVRARTRRSPSQSSPSSRRSRRSRSSRNTAMDWDSASRNLLK